MAHAQCSGRVKTESDIRGGGGREHRGRVAFDAHRSASHRIERPFVMLCMDIHMYNLGDGGEINKNRTARRISYVLNREPPSPQLRLLLQGLDV